MNADICLELVEIVMNEELIKFIWQYLTEI